MSDLVHPDEVYDILPCFFRGEILVYVEGSEDKLFWEKIIENAKIKEKLEKAKINKKPRMKIAGDKETLIKIMRLIYEGYDDLIAIADNDYSEILETQLNHDRIVYTYGYSIENSLYCPNIIANYITSFVGSENLEKFKSKINEWYEKFCDDCFILLTYDLANVKYSKYIRVMGVSSARFLKKSSPDLDSNKIEEFIREIENLFSDDEIVECKYLLIWDTRDIRYLIRGHFLTEAVRRLIKELSYKESRKRLMIPNEEIVPFTSKLCENCNPPCADRNKIKKTIIKAFESLNA